MNHYHYYISEMFKDRPYRATCVWRIDTLTNQVRLRMSNGIDRLYTDNPKTWLGYIRIPRDAANKICKNWGHTFRGITTK